MDEVKEIAILLLEFYVALGLMVIGFGFMLAGKLGGASVARFYFGGPLRWTFWRLRRVIPGLMASIWAALLAWLLRPLGVRLLRALQWLASRERGWLRPW